MPKNWQEEVREIIEQADELKAAPGRRGSRSPGRARSAASASPLEWLSRLGEWTRRRVATPGEMLVTAASLVVLALLLSVFLPRVASIFAVVGGVLFAVALVRSIVERRSGASKPSGSGPVMWRGQVIEVRQPRRSSLGERLRALWRRRR